MNVQLKGSWDRLQAFASQVGDTPLTEIATPPGAARIFAKCEWDNPTGSIKDRAAYAMLVDLLQQTPADDWHKLHILEYSGGNLGLSLAAMCRELQIRLTLVLSSGVSKRIVNRLEELGAEVILVDKERGFWGVMEHAMELSERNPSYSFLYQHTNEANFIAHRKHTGSEIVNQLPVSRIDAWVASVGTGGTLMGVYAALVESFPQVQLHLVIPAELPYGSPNPPNGLRKYNGSGGLGNGRKQPFVQREEERLSRQWPISFPETLREMKRQYEETGIRIGTSAAANLLVARQVADELGPNATVVTIFPDAGTPEEWEDVYRDS